MRPFLVAVAVVLIASAGAVGWWQHNRMEVGCLLSLLADADSQDAGQRSWRRWQHFHNYTPSGTCKPESEEELWAEMERTSRELNWAESHYYLALKKGYGNGATVWDANPARESKRKDDYWLPDAEYGMPLNIYLAGEGGDGENTDVREAFALMTRAAEQGLFAAQVELSEAYRTGKWGWRGALALGADAAQSAHWLEQAAESAAKADSDSPPEDAQFAAGYRWRYAGQFGLEPDYAKAQKYFLSAAESGHPAAMTELALMYAQGIVGGRDLAKAREWAAKADRLINFHGPLPYSEIFYAKLRAPSSEVHNKLRVQLAQHSQ